MEQTQSETTPRGAMHVARMKLESDNTINTLLQIPLSSTMGPNFLTPILKFRAQKLADLEFFDDTTQHFLIMTDYLLLIYMKLNYNFEQNTRFNLNPNKDIFDLQFQCITKD